MAPRLVDHQLAEYVLTPTAIHSVIEAVRLSASEGAILRIRGYSSAFCLGGYIPSMLSEDPSEVREYLTSLVTLIRSIAGHPLGVLAELEGPAIGGGAEIVLACKYRFAGCNANIQLSECLFGLRPTPYAEAVIRHHFPEAEFFDIIERSAIVPAARLVESGLADWTENKGGKSQLTEGNEALALGPEVLDDFVLDTLERLKLKAVRRRLSAALRLRSENKHYEPLQRPPH